MVYQDISSTRSLFTARSSLKKTQRAHSSIAATDAFNCWWYRTAAQNEAVVAQASTLMSEHRRIDSAGYASNGPAH
jgi:hypothetical protein